MHQKNVRTQKNMTAYNRDRKRETWHCDTIKMQGLS